MINNIGDQKIFNLLIDFQNINQESSIIPIIINWAIMTSFQLLETLFLEIFHYYSWNDFMRWDIESRFKQIEKDNDIFHNNPEIGQVVWRKILNSVLEYNKRRDLCTHSFGRITSKYLKFLNDHLDIKKQLDSLNNLGSYKQTQKYKVWEFLFTSPKYYEINQTLLDIVACKTCIYLLFLESNKNVYKYIAEILITLFTNKK